MQCPSGVDDHDSPDSFYLLSLNCCVFLGKDSGVVPHCLLYSLKFRIFLDWLPSKSPVYPAIYVKAGWRRDGFMLLPAALV